MDDPATPTADGPAPAPPLTAPSTLSQQFTADALAEWAVFLAQYQAGAFPRDAPPPIPAAISLLLASPSAASDNNGVAAPSWLNNRWARPETPEELLEFFRIHRYLPSPVSEDEAKRRAIIRRYGLDDTNRLASIDSIADLGRLYYKNVTVIVTAVLEDTVLLLGQAAVEDDKMDWGGALRDLDQSLSLCRHGMLGKREDTFLILDSATDWRVADNPVFSQRGGPLSFYASSRVLLPLSDAPSADGAPAPTLAVGNFCLLGRDSRAPGSFTEGDHSVLRNLASRVSRELQLGYEERRRLRAQEQALFVSQLLQEGQSSQVDISRRSMKESPGMSAVNRDQLSLGMSLLSTNAADALVSAIDKMCRLSTATSATVLDMRSFVKSSNESSTMADPRRPALRRTYSATMSTQRAQGTIQGADGTSFSVQRLRPISVLGSSGAESGLGERLNGHESLLSVERALQQWRSDHKRDYLLGDALAAPLSSTTASSTSTSSNRLAIPILDHADQLALLILISCDEGVLLEPSDKSFLENVGHILLSRLAKEQAIQADHAKLAFVSQISHELRTPLHGLAGQLELIRAACTASPQAPVDAQTFAVADVCLESLREILDDTLSFAKLSQVGAASSRPTLEPAEASELVDLSALLRDTTKSAWARKMRRESAEGEGDWSQGAEDVEVVLDFAGREEGWQASVGVADWRRTLANILSNAFTFTPAGGKVTVKLLESETADGQSAVAVQIEDTGIGMSDEFLASGQLFQPFRQGNSFNPGSGLGMAIVNELVMRMHGRVNVHSVLGQGTHVEVILPVTFVPSSPAAPVIQTLADELGDLTKCLGSPQPSHHYASRSDSFSVPSSVGSMTLTADGCDSASDESSIHTPPSASPIIPPTKLGFEPCDAHGRRKFTIFAAEDNLIARRLLTALFTEQKGFNFFAVEDGQRAVDVFKSGQFRPDVTLMDVQMPRKDGIAASYEMREHELEMGWNRHRIIALTGLSNPEDMAKGLDNGGPIDDWVCKGGTALKHISEEIEEMRRRLEREGTVGR
ncbi:hypothetical protein BCR35DRAFT_307281 [Leucosporidium creatinivorum]|uniref:histidine kinase n=1 Tax=Leucosporidium creatinivorum TaxID=106004 RepID=A0A1Y2ENZ2_9BASI|nr:hypothetical protein BCR35DRAFT_307281 [Leucosporidium creatinivorum]